MSMAQYNTVITASNVTCSYHSFVSLESSMCIGLSCHLEQLSSTQIISIFMQQKVTSIEISNSLTKYLNSHSLNYALDTVLVLIKLTNLQLHCGCVAVPVNCNFVVISPCFVIFKNVVHSLEPGGTPSNYSASHQASNYVQRS